LEIRVRLDTDHDEGFVEIGVEGNNLVVEIDNLLISNCGMSMDNFFLEEFVPKNSGGSIQNSSMLEELCYPLNLGWEFQQK